MTFAFKLVLFKSFSCIFKKLSWLEYLYFLLNCCIFHFSYLVALWFLLPSAEKLKFLSTFFLFFSTPVFVHLESNKHTGDVCAFRKFILFISSVYYVIQFALNMTQLKHFWVALTSVYCLPWCVSQPDSQQPTVSTRSEYPIGNLIIITLFLAMIVILTFAFVHLMVIM